jgi:hypothetical protein
MTPVSGRPRRSWRALVAALALILALPVAATGAQGHPNQAPKITVLAPGGQAIGLIDSGQLFDGETFEGIPDGLGVAPVGNGKRYIDIYVTFEQSHVPFQGFADFEDSSVQVARLDLKTRQIVSLEEVLPPSAGFVRFCSAFMAGPDEGFGDYTFLVNEESVDWLPIPDGAPYGADPFSNSLAYPYRQAGYSVWIDTQTGDYKPVPGMGRHNHENTVVVPGGWDDIVSLSGDDTFAAPSSQLYMYTADSPGKFKQDKGSLYAFQVTGRNGTPLGDPNDPFNDANDYLEIAPGDNWQGRFIPVPDSIADGTTNVPPQQALEDWSNANNVFQFVRIEDVAYDPDSPRTVYFADTGTTRLKESTSTGRLFRAGSTAFPYYDSDGRMFKMVLNAGDPTMVDSFSILAQGRLARQDPGATPADPPIVTVIDAGVGFVNPDNIDVGHTSLMVQEDASANNDVWQHPLGTSTWTKVASTTQTATAETSGIVDASDWLGAGWWILDVQSHVNLPVPVPAGTWGDDPANEPIYPLGPANGSSYSLRREDGQLLLMFIPGS